MCIQTNVLMEQKEVNTPGKNESGVVSGLMKETVLILLSFVNLTNSIIRVCTKINAVRKSINYKVF